MGVAGVLLAPLHRRLHPTQAGGRNDQPHRPAGRIGRVTVVHHEGHHRPEPGVAHLGHRRVGSQPAHQFARVRLHALHPQG